MHSNTYIFLQILKNFQINHFSRILLECHKKVTVSEKCKVKSFKTSIDPTHAIMTHVYDHIKDQINRAHCYVHLEL